MSEKSIRPVVGVVSDDDLSSRTSGLRVPGAPQMAATWAGENWPTSTPEEQGINSAKLVEMLAFYEEKRAKNEQIQIDSITVVRNGAIVADIYLNYSKKGKQQIVYRVGLDSVYRLTETGEGTFAATGSWSGPDTFTINYELVGYSTRGKWMLTFDRDEIAVVEEGVTGVYRYGGRATL